MKCCGWREGGFRILRAHLARAGTLNGAGTDAGVMQRTDEPMRSCGIASCCSAVTGRGRVEALPESLVVVGVEYLVERRRDLLKGI